MNNEVFYSCGIIDQKNAAYFAAKIRKKRRITKLFRFYRPIQTENASENKAKMQYAYMAYCAMRVNFIGFMILVLAIISKFDD